MNRERVRIDDKSIDFTDLVSVGGSDACPKRHPRPGGSLRVRCGQGAFEANRVSGGLGNLIPVDEPRWTAHTGCVELDEASAQQLEPQLVRNLRLSQDAVGDGQRDGGA